MLCLLACMCQFRYVSCLFSYLGFFFLCCYVTQPVATTRKSTVHVDRQNSEISYYADDEDGNHKKYSRRGKLKKKALVHEAFLLSS